MNIEIINANLAKEDYEILINLLDRMNFNYTTSESKEGMERRFSLKEAVEIWNHGFERALYRGSPQHLQGKQEYFKDKFNILID